MSAGAESTDGELTAAQIDRGYFLLALTSFVFYIGFQIVQAIQPNFFRDVLGMNGAQNGYLIAIRELPGFLLIFVAAFLLRLGLSRATSISLLIMGIGYCVFAFADSFGQLIIPTLIASIGFHSWLQLQPALGLSLTRRGNEGTMLGRINGIGFLGSLLGLLGVFALLTWIERAKGPLEEYQEPYLRGLFFVVLISGVLGAILIYKFPMSANDRAAAAVAPRIVWRKEYYLYYALSFLDGSRQQIYFAFAPFVLVEEFGVDARTMTVLLIISALINWRAGPPIGRLVDRIGEKQFLTIAYIAHFFVFLGFALTRNVYLLYAFYLGYQFLFLFSVGTTTYLKKIAKREDIAPSLAMGVSLAHLTAVIVPIIGSALWSRLGYQFPFLFGTVFVVISLILTQRINASTQGFNAPEHAR
ncbi:MAG: MFS transporter [Thermomicrobiales bacterium]|nr:MFS transporter [Thermomicrobiales bacterium]